MSEDLLDPESIVKKCKTAIMKAKGLEKGKIFIKMGDAYQKMKKPAKAVVCYREAMGSGIEDIDFFENFSQLLSNSGDNEEADKVIAIGLKKIQIKLDKARLLKTQAYIKRNSGSYEEARALGKRAFNMMKTRKNPGQDVIRLLAEAGNIVAISNWEMGDFEACKRWFERALEHFESIEDHSGMARLNNNLGFLNFQLGEADKALEHYSKAIEAEEKAETHFGGATVYNNIGLVYVAKGQYDMAEKSFKKCIRLSKKTGYLYSVPLAQMNLADMFIEKGEIIKARTWSELALKAFQKLKEKPREAQVITTMALIALFEDDLDKAGELVEEAYRIGHDHKAHEAITLSNRVMGMVQAAKGDHGTAVKLFRSVVEAHKRASNSWALALTLKELARSLKALGEDEATERTASEARRIFTKFGSEVELGRMDELGI